MEAATRIVMFEQNLLFHIALYHWRPDETTRPSSLSHVSVTAALYREEIETNTDYLQLGLIDQLMPIRYRLGSVP